MRVSRNCRDLRDYFEAQMKRGGKVCEAYSGTDEQTRPGELRGRAQREQDRGGGQIGSSQGGPWMTGVQIRVRGSPGRILSRGMLFIFKIVLAMSFGIFFFLFSLSTLTHSPPHNRPWG